MNPITVLLAEDHCIVRQGLRALLNTEADIRVVGEAENGHQAVAFASKLCPDVVVMDISMPLLDGMEATRRIHSHTPSTKVLVLSVHDTPAYVEEARSLGASGYLSKVQSADLLPTAIRAVHGGQFFFNPGEATPETQP